MIATVFQIATGLKTQYYRLDHEATKRAHCELYITYIVCLVAFAGVLTMEILRLNGAMGLTMSTNLLTFICYSVLMAAGYIFCMHQLFKYINKVDSYGLMSEYSKMVR